MFKISTIKPFSNFAPIESLNVLAGGVDIVSWDTELGKCDEIKVIIRKQLGQAYYFLRDEINAGLLIETDGTAKAFIKSAQTQIDYALGTVEITFYSSIYLLNYVPRLLPVNYDYTGAVSSFLNSISTSNLFSFKLIGDDDIIKLRTGKYRPYDLLVEATKAATGFTFRDAGLDGNGTNIIEFGDFSKQKPSIGARYFQVSNLNPNYIQIIGVPKLSKNGDIASRVIASSSSQGSGENEALYLSDNLVIRTKPRFPLKWFGETTNSGLKILSIVALDNVGILAGVDKPDYFETSLSLNSDNDQDLADLNEAGGYNNSNAPAQILYNRAVNNIMSKKYYSTFNFGFRSNFFINCGTMVDVDYKGEITYTGNQILNNIKYNSKDIANWIENRINNN